MEEFQKSLKNQSNLEIKEISQDRINYKLSLRKNKFNEILFKKRIIPTKPEDSPWTHELFLSNLQLPSNYKIIFGKDAEEISTALKAINSDILFEVQYGICLLKNYMGWMLLSTVFLYCSNASPTVSAPPSLIISIRDSITETESTSLPRYAS